MSSQPCPVLVTTAATDVVLVDGRDPVLLVPEQDTPTVLTTGAQGPRGPKGADGSPGTAYEHTQAIASDTWTVNHNLGFWPTVTVFGPGNSPVNAGVLHTSLNQCVISFVVPMTGMVRCN